MIGLVAGLATAGAVAALASGVVYFERQELRRQQREWRQWSAAHQWRYEPHDRVMVARWRAAPFGRGHTRVATHLITGVWDGLPVIFAHYTAVSGAGRSRRQLARSFAQFRTPASFPRLEIRRGSTPHVTADIQFESAPFNDAFDVRATDRRFASDIVHPRFMTALLDGKLGDAHISFEKGAITVWCDGHLPRTKALSLIQRLVETVRMIPAHVWQDQGVAVPQLTNTGASAIPDTPDLGQSRDPAS